MSTNASVPDAWSEAAMDKMRTPLDEEILRILFEAVDEMDLEWSAPDQP